MRPNQMWHAPRVPDWATATCVTRLAGLLVSVGGLPWYAMEACLCFSFSCWKRMNFVLLRCCRAYSGENAVSPIASLETICKYWESKEYFATAATPVDLARCRQRVRMCDEVTDLALQRGFLFVWWRDVLVKGFKFRKYVNTNVCVNHEKHASLFCGVLFF